MSWHRTHSGLLHMSVGGILRVAAKVVAKGLFRVAKRLHDLARFSRVVGMPMPWSVQCAFTHRVVWDGEDLAHDLETGLSERCVRLRSARAGERQAIPPYLACLVQWVCSVFAQVAEVL